MELRTELTFDAAHMLSNYDGKCNNLHGHTYKCEVVVVGKPDAETCMLIDFNDIKGVVNKYDHAIIFGGIQVREKAEDELLKWAEEHGKNHVLMPADMKPTAESMCKVFAKTIAGMYAGISAVSVRIWETPKSSAEYTENNG